MQKNFNHMSTFLLSLLFCTLTMINSESQLFQSQKIQKLRRVRDLLTTASRLQLFFRDLGDGKITTAGFELDAIVSDIYADKGLKQSQWNIVFQKQKLPMQAKLTDYKTTAEEPIEIHPSSYTDQIFDAFADTNLKEIFRGEGKDLGDCCTWPEVTCDDGVPVVLDITAQYYWELKGASVDLDSLPKTLKSISISKFEINSAIDFAHLPPQLESLTMAFNAFAGNVLFSHLPNTLKHLILRNNKFSCRIDYSNLPQNLENLVLQSMPLDGDLIIKGPLPRQLKSIDLIAIPFNGGVNLQGMENRNVELNIDIFHGSKQFQINFITAMKQSGVEEKCTMTFM